MWKFSVSLSLGSADLMGYRDVTKDKPDKVEKIGDWKKLNMSLNENEEMHRMSCMRLQSRLINCATPKEA